MEESSSGSGGPSRHTATYQLLPRAPSTSSMTEDDKRSMASMIQRECSSFGTSWQLDALLDEVLAPDKPIDNFDDIDWCKWIIAGGRDPLEFASIVRGYDNHAKCGLVWIPHAVAYRCRTCGISPCMSICRECFKRGNHQNHDFNMFLSQAGGACDCGDTSVMKAEGFCCDHGINKRVNKAPIPNDLMSVAEAIMPKLLLRLLLHFRGNHKYKAQSLDYEQIAKECDMYCSMLMELNNMGELMRRVMTRALINPTMYKQLLDTSTYSKHSSKFAQHIELSKSKYELAVEMFPSPKPPDDYKHLPALGETIVHCTFLEEFIFWTFKYEFPQNVVCFLLNMLPDQDYKVYLTRTFVMHYSRIPTVLEMSSDPDTLSNRVVHMSVQLFSNEALALKMVEELNLLHVMIISLKLMMSKILIRNTLHDPKKNFHYVIDCAKRVMKEHCYWPLVSDFNNVLSHESVALVFLRDDDLIDMWFQFLSMLQGMNVNIRETTSHVEFEPSSYYAAFSCELEASAYPMWSIISHLKDSTHAPLAKKMIKFCINYLQEWLDAIYFSHPKIEKNELMHASFHFPLHRYLASFACQAVKTMGIPLTDILPPSDLLTYLMMHPLRVQSLFYEILSGIWVRNGLQIKGQAMTYIQANFCNSMVDMDMFFLQICATQLPANFFLTAAIDIFGVNQWLGMGPLTSPQEMEQDSMLEGLLTFLATLVISRTNLGNDEQTQCVIEISALLATGDKTHSQLLELMPERSGNAHTRSFEKFLKELSVYRPPPLGSENLEQGLFMPTAKVWEEYYDPLHVLLRAVHRRDFQNSMDRFSNYVKQEKKMPTSGSLWPPFRLPTSVSTEYGDPASVLNSKVLHATILGIFYRAVHTHSVSEHLLALGVFLLEMAVVVEERLKKSESAMEACPHSSTSSYYGEGEAPELLHCFPGNNLSENLRLMVNKVSLRSMEPHQSPVNYNNAQFDSDLEWDVSEGDTLPILTGGRSIENAGGVDDGDSNSSALAIISHGNVGIIQGTPSTMEIAVPQDLSIVRENSLVVHSNNLQIVERMDDETSGVAHTPPSNAIQLITDIRRLDSMSSSSSTSSYPPPGTAALPPIPPVNTTATVDGGLEVAIRDQTGETSRSRSTPEMFSSNSSNSVMILPFNRVQPVAVPNRSLDIMPGATNPSGGAQQPRRILLSNSGTTTTTTSGGTGGTTTNVQHRKHVDTGALETSAVAGEIGSSADQQPTDPDTVVINESILSLLLKLHSQLSGTLDSFSLEDETEDEKMDADDGDEQPTTSTQQQQSSQQKSNHSPKVIKISESRLGDGPHFIGNLLKKLAKYDPQCAQSINDIRHKLWPNQRERQAELKAREAKEKEERTKRARERQRKLMQEFANKQKQFMAQAMESEIDMEGIDDDEEELLEAAREKEYDCIICNTTGPSTESNPMGLVVYVESTSLVGHRRVTDQRFPLPISDADKEMPGRGVNLATEFNNRVKLLTWKFGGNTWFLSHNINWEGGVHVQSCGHHVHLTCQDAYLKSLHTSQRPQTLNVERGEFFCPVCRQLANSVLPLSPQQDRPTPLVRTPTISFSQQVMDLMRLMRENKRPTTTTKFYEAMGRAMENMTTATQRIVKKHPPTAHTLFSFVVSIARTNLESEVIQRGGTLCNATNELDAMAMLRIKPKRDCIVPLLHVLSLHALVLYKDSPVWRVWANICGVQTGENNTPVPSYHSYEIIPSLLSDPCALMLKFILMSPLQLDQAYFTCIVKIMYNLLYYQVIVQLCLDLDDGEKQFIIEKYGMQVVNVDDIGAASMSMGQSNSCKLGADGAKNLPTAMALVLQNLYKPDAVKFYRSQQTAGQNPSKPKLNLNDLEVQLQSLCLPFLRIAALLRYHIYHHDLPEINNPHQEFARLTYYLELVTKSMDWKDFNATKALSFVPGTEFSLPNSWCQHLLEVMMTYRQTTDLIGSQHVNWHQPRLLGLPREYERLFTYYHEQQCQKCNSVPKESSICLLCGTIVCLKQRCCKEQDCCEAVRHSISCGGGTGIFLVVTSTYIIIIRGRRACLWGSLYLDDYDEEDRDLKRGKPLYLSQDRYNLLESQWLSHRFAHTKHTWVWHRDSL